MEGFYSAGARVALKAQSSAEDYNSVIIKFHRIIENKFRDYKEEIVDSRNHS